MHRPLCALLSVQESCGICPGRGGVQGQARLCGWVDRDTIAGLPVPPSGGQETLRGHPSPRPGCCWAQQTFPSQVSLSHHPARPACLQQPPQSHTLPCSRPAYPASSLPTLALGLGDCIKHRHGSDRGIYSRCSLLIISSTVLLSHWVSILHGVSTERPGQRSIASAHELQCPESIRATLIRGCFMNAPQKGTHIF